MTVTFRDAVAAAIAIVTPAVTIPVVSRVPNPRPDSFVRLIRTGGTRRNVVIDEATITVEAWAPDEAAAQDCAQTVRAALHASHMTFVAGFGSVYRVTELAGPAYSPDPETGHDRYVFSVSIAIRGVAS